VKRLAFGFLFALVATALGADIPRRLVILKVDGMGQDQLMAALEKRDPGDRQVAIAVAAANLCRTRHHLRKLLHPRYQPQRPSWSMLDTGHHLVIRGNVEYDRFTGEVYDYLNFFPLYIGYARQRQVDMPGVEVLDRAGIPLLIDHFQYPKFTKVFSFFSAACAGPP
jgi:hypothetical protein